jgi:hypothetical protein
MKRIDTFNKFNESEDNKRFVGPNGEFQLVCQSIIYQLGQQN